MDESSWAMLLTPAYFAKNTHVPIQFYGSRVRKLLGSQPVWTTDKGAGTAQRCLYELCFFTMLHTYTYRVKMTLVCL